MTDHPPTGDTPTHGVHVIPGDLRELLAQEIHLHCPARPYGGNCRCTAMAERLLTLVDAETDKLRRQVMGYRGMKDVYLRERNAAWDELLQAERLVEALCSDVDNGQRMVKAALTEQRERAERAERERDAALAAVADEQRRADERRTELLEERDEALNALADTERQRAEALAAVQRVRDLHQPTKGMGFDCDEDDTPGSYGDIAKVCTSCGTSDEYGVRWPCPTLAALNPTETP